jgi:hypothetical protein
MKNSNYTFTDLFNQLGLPSDQDSIKAFIKSQRPLNPSTRMEDAPFWTSSQRQFIQEQLANNSDWAELIDQLSLSLR